MEAITLAPSRLTPWRYFGIIAVLRLRRTWWALAVCLVGGVYLLTRTDADLTIRALGWFGVGYPLIVYVYILVWCYLPKNRVVYEERRTEMNAERLLVDTEKGARSEVPWSYVRRVQETAGQFLLHIGAGRMILLPKASFRSAEDIATFKRWIAARKPL